MTNEITVQENQEIVLKDSEGRIKTSSFFDLSTFESAMKVAEVMANSVWCPPAFKGKVGDVLIALEVACNLGIRPSLALQNMAVINSKPCIFGDLMLALCRGCPDWEYLQEEYVPEIKGYRCTAKRKNEPPSTEEFTEAMAKQAGLWGKTGPWSSYPRIMLKWRARTFVLRNVYPDILKGMISYQEAKDYPPVRKDYSNLKKGSNIIDAVAEIEEDVPFQDAIDKDELDTIRLILAECADRDALESQYKNIMKGYESNKSMRDKIKALAGEIGAKFKGDKNERIIN